VKSVLTAVEKGLVEVWTQVCGDLGGVSVHEGSILDVSCEAVVSPANGFGFMDGGIDARYSEYFGWHGQDRLRKLILDHHHGELVIGAAEIVETDDVRLP